MGEINKKENVPGFWRRNWLTLVAMGVLFWAGLCYWQAFIRISPFLIIVLSFFLYLFVVKFFYDNRLSCEHLFTELREGGWIVIRAFVRPGFVIWQKLGTGMDLITQRLGVEQELVIAEKRKKKLEIELSHRRLHVQLAEMQVVPSAAAPLSDNPEMPEKESVMFSKSLTEQVPPYAKYAPVLMRYLDEVRWERFTVTQAQQILHKRFGTVKLVLEELVHQQKLEYVRTGKRVAYRPVTNENNE